VTLQGNINHSSDQGDGVVFSIHAKGKIIYQTTQLNAKQTHGPHNIQLRAGETVDLVATAGSSSSFDSFEWTATLQTTTPNGQSYERDSQNHFSGPFTQQKTRPLDRLEQLSQILILSNEFAFID